MRMLAIIYEAFVYRLGLSPGWNIPQTDLLRSTTKRTTERLRSPFNHGQMPATALAAYSRLPTSNWDIGVLHTLAEGEPQLQSHGIWLIRSSHMLATGLSLLDPLTVEALEYDLGKRAPRHTGF